MPCTSTTNNESGTLKLSRPWLDSRQNKRHKSGRLLILPVIHRQCVSRGITTTRPRQHLLPRLSARLSDSVEFRKFKTLLGEKVLDEGPHVANKTAHHLKQWDKHRRSLRRSCRIQIEGSGPPYTVDRLIQRGIKSM